MAFQTIITAKDWPEYWRLCKEKEDAGYEIVKWWKEYKAPKNYHTRIDSNPRLNRTTFAGTEEIVKYRAIYRRVSE